MTEMNDENNVTIGVAFDPNPRPKAMDYKSSDEDTVGRPYVPSEARMKTSKNWSFGYQMPLTAITKCGSNEQQIKRKSSPKKQKKIEIDINSNEHKELMTQYKDTIECVVNSCDPQMDHLVVTTGMNGMNVMNGINGLIEDNRCDENNVKTECEVNVDNNCVQNSYLNTFKTFITSKNQTKRKRITTNGNDIDVKRSQCDITVPQSCGQMQSPMDCNSGDNCVTNSSEVKSSDNCVDNTVDEELNSINSVIQNVLKEEMISDSEEVKPPKKRHKKESGFKSRANNGSKPMKNTFKSSVKSLAKDFQKNFQTFISRKTKLNTKSENRLKLNKRVPKVSETQRMAQKRVKQLRGLKTTNAKIVRKKLNVFKGFQHSFLDFIVKKYSYKEGVPFIQDRSCKDLAKEYESSNLSFCIDCNGNRSDSQTCRFFQYRTLVKNNGQLSVSAFSEEGDAGQEDARLWLPITNPKNLDPINAKYLMTFVGQHLCRMYSSEMKVREDSVSVTWKKPVKGIRELCDVCLTTIFNTHHVCPKCGFAVCVDCFVSRKTEPMASHYNVRRNHDEYNWRLCNNKERHVMEGLHLAIFFTKTIFNSIDVISHNIRNDNKILGVCDCHRIKSDVNIDVRQMCSDIDLKTMYVNVPREWLCNDRLLVLTQPKCEDNLKLFQVFWLRGYPVLIQSVDKSLKHHIWSPQSFNNRFGRQTSRLVNCMNGSIIPKRPMSDFWNGFEEVSKRLIDEESGEEMILKLKDWPPTEEFRDKLPLWFDDLMDALPLKEYTRYDGARNLASRLPEFFVRPDLGPKMYCAYGSVLFTSKGTTNLHLDMSDAVNVMIYVGVAQKDGQPIEAHLKGTNDVLLKGGCDEDMMTRAKSTGLKVGALWHIWRAEDADKIREFLYRVSKENGMKVETNTDPIHDQSWYLDETLRTRLESEYNVSACAIAQCLGDAILVPAGAPHQVQNVHSCIKVAGEFVSPENISHCLSLTHEFRRLSKRHNNHEDKLQIKNIIYHTIKDSLALLLPPSPHPSQASPKPLVPVFSANEVPINTSNPFIAETDESIDHNIPPTPPNSTEKPSNASTAQTSLAGSESVANVCDTETTDLPVINAPVVSHMNSLNDNIDTIRSELLEPSIPESSLVEEIPLGSDPLSPPPLLKPFYDSDSNHSFKPLSPSTHCLSEMQSNDN